jgi:U32 family peptidase
MSLEILAPAGSREALTAAVRCGANAVYFGGKAFNARRNASNFSDEEIAEAIDYCHRHGVKVYVTLNTLASDGELFDASKEIEKICLAGVDAFIIQDLGLAEMVKEICPTVALHASTQMSVQSIEGLEILKEMGFRRAVLPRELSEKEIYNISQKTDMELECFVHGALCMCLSGQCLMSSVLGGRSGNRGLCAQPCRLPFGVNGKGGNNLSLKDLSLIDKISQLEKAGVTSLKIEGRMKRPEYVAAAVTACKNAINGTHNKEIDDALGAVFSRSGFTKGYFEGKLGKDMFGIRTKENVEKSSSVLSSLSHLYDNENPLIPVNMHFEMKKDKLAYLKISSGDFNAEVQSDILPSQAINKPITPEDAAARLSKCGGTQFYAENIECNIDDGLNMPVSALNALRRDALNKIENKISEKEPVKINSFNFVAEKHKSSSRELHVRFLDKEQIPNEINAQRVIIPLDTDDETILRLVESDAQVAAEIPVNVFSFGELYLKELNRLKNLGVELAWVCNIDGIKIAQNADMKFAAGFGMNIFNSESLKIVENFGAEDALLSSELSVNKISNMGTDLKRGVLVYGRLPLMVTRNCPIKNKISCAECGRNSELWDRMNIKFPVRCKYGCSYILNSRPLCVYDRKNEFKNIDYDLLYFTTESASECVQIINNYHKNMPPEYEYTKGLYYKNVL